MHVTKIIFSFFAKLDMLITTIGIITIGTGMLGTTFGKEIVMIKKKVQFSLKGPEITPIKIFHFSMLSMPKMTLEIGLTKLLHV